MTQPLRPSQFIITYGPGTILESKDGPVIIPTPDRGLFANSSLDPNDYKIENERMAKFLSEDPDVETKIFRLPTNAELSMSSKEHIYRTKSFPNWKLCLNRNSHPDETDVLYLNPSCPVCRDPNGGRADTIRFVMVCQDGHLNDVGWDYLVHGKNSCSHSQVGKIPTQLNNPYVFQWIRTGGALKDIEVKCPRCNSQQNFGKSFYRDWKCSGRSPERESVKQPPVPQPGCKKPAKIIQRQAANIRIPEIKTLLSIQSVYTKLHHLVQNEKISSTIRNAKSFMGEIDSKERFAKVIDAMRDNKVSENSLREFSNASWPEIQQVIDYMDAPIPDSYHEMILDEFRELLKASVEGAPPSAYAVKSKPIFEIIKHDIRQFNAPNGRTFTVTPVNALETITVQTGFRRAVSEDVENPTQPVTKLIGVDFYDKFGTRWLPGASFMGEGIFIRLDDEGWTDNLQGDSAAEWLASLNLSDDYREFVFRNSERSRDELHPGFVWWHTFAHLLIRAISEEAGYSTASIRERIYFERKGGKSRGGILLYAAQPGTEGTLGGLTGLVPIFDAFLNQALETSKTCSADPICSQQEFKHKRVNGSCCYGCLMNSETSCEHRNLWLDRTIVRENMP